MLINYDVKTFQGEKVWAYLLQMHIHCCGLTTLQQLPLTIIHAVARNVKNANVALSQKKVI